MNAQFRPALVVMVAFLLAVCIFGLRFACDPSGLRELLQEGLRYELLVQFRRSSTRHWQAKAQVMQEVIDQQCSLSEALALLEELDREWLQELEREFPTYAIGIAESYRKAWSDEDYYYGIIITRRVAGLLQDRPEEAAAVLRRLEKDYQQIRTRRQKKPAIAPIERTKP